MLPDGITMVGHGSTMQSACDTHDAFFAFGQYEIASWGGVRIYRGRVCMLKCNCLILELGWSWAGWTCLGLRLVRGGGSGLFLNSK